MVAVFDVYHHILAFQYVPVLRLIGFSSRWNTQTGLGKRVLLSGSSSTRHKAAPQRMLFPASLAGPAPQHTCMLSNCYLGAQPSLIDMYGLQRTNTCMGDAEQQQPVSLIRPNGLTSWAHPADIGNENLWGETRGLLASPESVLRFDFSNSEGANIQWAEGRVVEAPVPVSFLTLCPFGVPVRTELYRMVIVCAMTRLFVLPTPPCPPPRSTPTERKSTSKDQTC